MEKRMQKRDKVLGAKATHPWQKYKLDVLHV